MRGILSRLNDGISGVVVWLIGGIAVGWGLAKAGVLGALPFLATLIP